MEAATTRRAPGTRLAKVSISSSTPTPAIARRAAGTTIYPEYHASVVSWSMRLPLTWMPRIPGSSVSATWMPTPLRKPIGRCATGVGEEAEAQQPRHQQVFRRHQSDDAGQGDVFLARQLAIVTRAATSMAAVAESAPTTRWRDEPKRAKTIAGTAM